MVEIAFSSKNSDSCENSIEMKRPLSGSDIHI